MISVVIPVYNCTALLIDYLEQLTALLKRQKIPFEYILVDDGSAAPTKAILAQLAKRDDLRVIANRQNCGQQIATFVGLKAARGELLLTLDDDCKHDLTIIPQLIERLTAGSDIAFGIERNKSEKPWRTCFSLPVSHLINRRFPMANQYYVSSFRCFKRHLLVVDDYQKDFFYISCELLKRASKVANVFYQPPMTCPSRYKFGEKMTLFYKIVKRYGW